MESVVKVSWSKLRNHEECRQRTHLMRQGKRDKTQDQRGFFAGTVTDRVVRDWLMNDPDSHIGEMPGMVVDIIDREKTTIEEEGGVMKWKHLDDRNEVIADCSEAVRRIEAPLLKYVVPYDYSPAYRFEVPVIFEDKAIDRQVKVILNGELDILTKPDGFRIWDVKHTKNDDYWRKTVGQLTFYDIAVGLQYGEDTKSVGLLQPLCKEQVKVFKVTHETRVQMLQRIENMAWDILNDVSEPRKDSKYCYFCSVKHACIRYAPTVDKNGKNKVKF